DVLELLPRDSPGFQSFEHRLERVGGRATINVVCESPDRSANERFIDALATAIEKTVADRRSCVAACATDDAACIEACGPDLVDFVERGTKDARAFFQDNQWLYASLEELEEADSALDRQIAI